MHLRAPVRVPVCASVCVCMSPVLCAYLVKMLPLASGSLSVCLSVRLPVCVCLHVPIPPYLLYREEHSEKVSSAEICTNYVQPVLPMVKMPFSGAYWRECRPGIYVLSVKVAF